MVVIYTGGVISRDGGGRFKRQVPVQQTAGDTPKKTSSTLKCYIIFDFDKYICTHAHIYVCVPMAAVGSRGISTRVGDSHLQDRGFVVGAG